MANRIYNTPQNAATTAELNSPKEKPARESKTYNVCWNVAGARFTSILPMTKGQAEAFIARQRENGIDARKA